MQVEVFRVKESKGFILYQRAKTKFKGYAPMLKFFISQEGGKYFKEFRTQREAIKEFNSLTKN